MRRYMTIDEFRKRFRAVDPHEAAAQEPNKYYDSFIERKYKERDKRKEAKENQKEKSLARPGWRGDLKGMLNAGYYPAK